MKCNTLMLIFVFSFSFPRLGSTKKKSALKAVIPITNDCDPDMEGTDDDARDPDYIYGSSDDEEEIFGYKVNLI